MSNLLSSQELQLSEAVRRAGAKLMEFWPGKEGGSRESLGIEKKSDGSFVTQADFASNEILVSTLQSLYPSDGILSEEIPASADLAAKNRLWIIDPLDGTQSFINANDDFSVLVALAVQQQAELGFMFFPARNRLGVAKRGHGAFVDGERVHVSSFATPRPESVYVRNFTPTRAELAYPRWMDSGCAFLTLAEGTLDGLIIKIVSHREWDLAAPAVVVEESGGKVTDENGAPIRFYPGSMQYKYFVASNGAAHEELLRLIPREDT